MTRRASTGHVTVGEFTGAEGKAANTTPLFCGINRWSPSIFLGSSSHKLDVKITVGYHGHILLHATRRSHPCIWARACRAQRIAWKPSRQIQSFYGIGARSTSPPAVTRLTVYCWLHIIMGAEICWSTGFGNMIANINQPIQFCDCLTHSHEIPIERSKVKYK